MNWPWKKRSKEQCEAYKFNLLMKKEARMARRAESKAEGHFSTKKNGIFNWMDYRHSGAKIAYIFIVIILLIAVFIAVGPVIWLFITSFKTTAELYQYPYRLLPEEFNIGKIGEVWNAIKFGSYFSNSLLISIGGALAAILFNGMIAYVLAIVKPVGHKILYGIVLLSYMIPTATNMVPLFKQIVAIGLVDSYLPLMLVWGANTYYLVIFKKYFETIPNELFEASRIDGANDLQIFFRILIPLARPIIGVVAIFAFTGAWSDFLLPRLVLYDEGMKTIMVKLYDIQATLGQGGEFTPDMLLMMLTLSIIPQLVVFLLFQKQITGASTEGGIKE